MLMLDRQNIRQANLDTSTCLYKPSTASVGVFAKFVPQLKLFAVSNPGSGRPDNLVGGAVMRTIPLLGWGS